MNCTICQDTGVVVDTAGEFATARVCDCNSPCPKCGGRGLVIDRTTQPATSRPCTCNETLRKVNLFNSSGIPAKMAHKTVAKYEVLGGTQARVQMELLRFEQVFVPGLKGRLLYGPPGTGKTHLVCALLSGFTLGRGFSAKFVDFFHLLSQIKAGFSMGRGEEELLAPLVAVDVLVIDELGKGRATDWEISVLDQLVSRRYNADRTILATTNLRVDSADPRDNAPALRLEDRIDERIVSRLLEMSPPLEVTGPDYRRRK